MVHFSGEDGDIPLGLKSWVMEIPKGDEVTVSEYVASKSKRVKELVS
jgi:hypothetical protein